MIRTEHVRQKSMTQEAIQPSDNVGHQIDRLVALEQELAAVRSRATVGESEGEVEKMKALILKQIGEIQTLKGVQKRISEDAIRQRTQTEHLSKVAQEQAKQIQAMSIQLQLFQELESSLRDQQEVIATESAYLRQENESSEGRIQSLMADNEKLKSRIAELESAPRVAEFKFAGSLAGSSSASSLDELSRKEIRLEGYARRLRSGQTMVREALNEALVELETAMRMNPTADLLKITEYELGRVEIEMKKTPTSSPSRRVLEENFEDLIQQRNFLRTVREASDKEAQSKLTRLQDILSDERLDEIPPPPPVGEI